MKKEMDAHIDENEDQAINELDKLLRELKLNRSKKQKQSCTSSSEKEGEENFKYIVINKIHCTLDCANPENGVFIMGNTVFH
jgi:hypothetical protein